MLGISLITRGRRTVAAIMAAALLSGTTAAEAATIVGAGGPGNLAQGINPGQAAGISFTLTAPIANASISADIFCINCTGDILLMKDNIGSTAQLTNLVGAVAFNVFTPLAPFFTGMNLDTGTYFMFLALSGNRGGAAWAASDPATFVSSANASPGLDFYADSLASPVFRSTFASIPETKAMHYRVEVFGGAGTPGAVPEPSTWILLIAGFCIVGTAMRQDRRRRRRLSGTVDQREHVQPGLNILKTSQPRKGT